MAAVEDHISQHNIAYRRAKMFLRLQIGLLVICAISIIAIIIFKIIGIHSDLIIPLGLMGTLCGLGTWLVGRAILANLKKVERVKYLVSDTKPTSHLENNTSRALGVRKRPFLHLLIRSLFNGATKSIGLDNAKPFVLKAGVHKLGEIMELTPYYPIFFQKDYISPTSRSTGTHIVVSQDNYMMHTYSPDIRESPVSTKKFSGILELAKHYAEMLKTRATNKMINEDETYQQVKDLKNYESLMAYSNLHQKFSVECDSASERYFKSIKARLLSRVISFLL